MYNSTGLAGYRHSDWLGSARLTSSPGGPSQPTQAISETAYGPFGEVYWSSGTADPSFTGMNQDADPNSGIYDFPAREYEMEGRWPSPDPLGVGAVDPTDPQSWNRYAYVRNSPLTLTDPNGMDYEVCLGGQYVSMNVPLKCTEVGGDTVSTLNANLPNDLEAVGNDSVGSIEWIGPEGDGDYGVYFRTGDSGGGGGGGDGGNGNNSNGGSSVGPAGTQSKPACAKPNFLNKLEIPILRRLAQKTGTTLGIGLSGSAGIGYFFGYSAGASGFLVVSPNGQAAFVYSLSSSTYPVGPVVGAGASVGPSVLVSSANSPSALAGESVQLAASGGDGIGAQGDLSIGSGGATLTFGPAFAAGSTGRALVLSSSTVVPICGS